MLLTSTSWAESHPVRKALVQPYQSWRCIGWTDETLKFWIALARDTPEDEHLLDGWLVDGPEVLLEVVAQLKPASYAVYALDGTSGGEGMRFCRVTGIWRECEQRGTVSAYWYRTADGVTRPCWRGLDHPAVPPRLENELALDDTERDAAADL